jgi:hypothetical protein
MKKEIRGEIRSLVGMRDRFGVSEFDEGVRAGD